YGPRAVLRQRLREDAGAVARPLGEPLAGRRLEGRIGPAHLALLADGARGREEEGRADLAVEGERVPAVVAERERAAHGEHVERGDGELGALLPRRQRGQGGRATGAAQRVGAGGVSAARVVLVERRLAGGGVCAGGGGREGGIVGAGVGGDRRRAGGEQ